MVRNIFLATGPTLFALGWVLRTLLSPSLTGYDATLTGEDTIHTISVTADGTAHDVYTGAVSKDLSATYPLDPHSGFPKQGAPQIGLTYFFPMPAEERSYVLYDPLLGESSTVDYIDPVLIDDLKMYTYRQTTPRFRELTVDPRSGTIIDAAEEVAGDFLRYDAASREAALAHAADMDKQHRSLAAVNLLLTLAGGFFLVAGSWLWLRTIL